MSERVECSWTHKDSTSLGNVDSRRKGKGSLHQAHQDEGGVFLHRHGLLKVKGATCNSRYGAKCCRRWRWGLNAGGCDGLSDDKGHCRDERPRRRDKFMLPKNIERRLCPSLGRKHSMKTHGVVIAVWEMCKWKAGRTRRGRRTP
jgi:hypothetical protein